VWGSTHIALSVIVPEEVLMVFVFARITTIWKWIALACLAAIHATLAQHPHSATRAQQQDLWSTELVCARQVTTIRE
jgi:hypothetical protein